MKRIKLGVFGMRRGGFVCAFAQQIPDEVVVTGVCDFDESAFTEYTKSLFTEETKIYDTFDELIHSGIDGVVLCNYFHEHAEYAIKAMEAGVAVLSETTAAASLGECVDLVEAAERTGAKYMLAANCPYMQAVHTMKKKIEDKEYGEVVYADAEYNHVVAPSENVNGAKGEGVDCDNLHWRQTNPATYYNMHSLGPLMYVTGTVPKKVVAKVGTVGSNPNKKITNGVKAYVITEMDNGAIFNTTGCTNVGTTSRWFRVSCEVGSMEIPRYDGVDKLIEVGHSQSIVKRTKCDWISSGALPREDVVKYNNHIAAAGHGGIDFVLMMHFVKYLRGEEQPFFDVYRSVALSAAGILGWYSVLQGSKELEIPDFKIKEERDKVRGDYRKPFAKKYSDLTLPCKVGDTM